MKRPRKPASRLSQSVHHRLNMYALAASAAGVGVLALAQPVDAKVIYTDSGSISIRWNHTYLLDLNHDGKTDFTIYNNLFYVTSGGLNIVSVKGASGNVVKGSVPGIGHPVLALKARGGHRGCPDVAKVSIPRLRNDGL